MCYPIANKSLQSRITEYTNQIRSGKNIVVVDKPENTHEWMQLGNNLTYNRKPNIDENDIFGSILGEDKEENIKAQEKLIKNIKQKSIMPDIEKTYDKNIVLKKEKCQVDVTKYVQNTYINEQSSSIELNKTEETEITIQENYNTEIEILETQIKITVKDENNTPEIEQTEITVHDNDITIKIEKQETEITVPGENNTIETEKTESKLENENNTYLDEQFNDIDYQYEVTQNIGLENIHGNYNDLTMDNLIDTSDSDHLVIDEDYDSDDLNTSGQSTSHIKKRSHKTEKKSKSKKIKSGNNSSESINITPKWVKKTKFHKDNEKEEELRNIQINNIPKGSKKTIDLRRQKKGCDNIYDLDIKTENSNNVKTKINPTIYINDDTINIICIKCITGINNGDSCDSCGSLLSWRLNKL